MLTRDIMRRFYQRLDGPEGDYKLAVDVLEELRQDGVSAPNRTTGQVYIHIAHWQDQGLVDSRKEELPEDAIRRPRPMYRRTNKETPDDFMLPTLADAVAVVRGAISRRIKERRAQAD